MLLSCPSAKAYTYATRIGTNVVDDVVIDIDIPKEYITNAIHFAAAETRFEATKSEMTEKEVAAKTFTRAVCTLVYTSWRGLYQPPYHYNGVGPSLLRMKDPEDFLRKQDAFTQKIFQQVSESLRVDSWYAGWSDGTTFDKECHVKLLRHTVKRIQSNLQSHVRRVGKSKRCMEQTMLHNRAHTMKHSRHVT